MNDPTVSGTGPTDSVVYESDTARAAAARFGLVVASVGESISDDDHLLEALGRLVDAACSAIGGADCSVLTVDVRGRTFTVCWPEKSTHAIDTEQYDIDNGPCLTAARTRATVFADCDALDSRWPEFGPTARQAGVHSMLAAPIATGTTVFGAINLYSHQPGAFDAIDADLVAVLTTVTARALGDYSTSRSALDTVDGLRTAMEHRAPIEQAKGILMALHRISADDAFAMLSTESQNTNRRVREIASDFVTTVVAAAPKCSPG
ncbi:GAF and ANTAR domain-containing protein [Rhodococcus sp. H29-C3]|uniref:GAF and ANTAR domain-containing protein n=1 Tax=Rhodococcus sp. H29-C3 TaxID=3046307 RepID=UPI0024B91806|nr:GAF and ANTAR domain-containing protein [Rhodococcus sp. H29-C3]MDJ0363009.1 GAF and ANTAR domain-containing protein [Rhodococcus sp. H29-C3]